MVLPLLIRLKKENKVLFSNQTLPHLTEFLNGKNVQRGSKLLLLVECPTFSPRVEYSEGPVRLTGSSSLGEFCISLREYPLPYSSLLGALPPQGALASYSRPNYLHFTSPPIPPVLSSSPGWISSYSRITIGIAIPVSVPWFPGRHSDTLVKCHQVKPLHDQLTPSFQHDKIKLGLLRLPPWQLR